jgi:integrase
MARGSLQKRGADSWRIRIYLGIGPDGRQQYHSETVCGTKKQAQQRMTEVLREMDMGQYVAPARLTVAEYLEQWLRDYAKPQTRPTTYDGYEMVVRVHLAPALGDTRLDQLRPYHIQRYYADKVDQLSPTTVRQHHRILRKALDCGVKWGLLASNPADAVDPPRPQKAAIDVWTPEEMAQFLMTPAVRQHRLFALFAMALDTGMRRGELVGLRWVDVDMQERVIHVRRSIVSTTQGRIVQPPKSSSGVRAIRFSEALAGWLRKHSTSQAKERLVAGSTWTDHDLVFPQPNGKPLNAHNLSARLFPRLCEGAGVPRIRFHDMRHTHATRLLEAGVPLKAVQERLGHASGATTIDIYSHVLQATADLAATAMDDVLRNLHVV